jgi:RIO-like serine/threonine protein kinase
MEYIVAQQFRMGQKIGIGNNADVYEGTNIRTGEEVALKLEPVRGSSRHLNNEHSVYKTLGTQGT